MKERKFLAKKVYLYFFLSFFAAIMSFFVYDLYTGSMTYGLLFNRWNGVGVASSFSGGDGSNDNPYLISDSFELAYLSKLVNERTQDSDGGYYYNKSYKLVNDIDLNNHSWHVIGNSSSNFFSGNFDGNGKIVYNLLIDSNHSDNYYGLFGNIVDGSINDLLIDSVSVNFDSFNDDSYVGTLAGYYETTSLVINNNIFVRNANVNVNFTDDVNVYSSYLIGYQSGDLVFNNVLITSDGIVSENTNNHFGIISGYNNNFTTNNCIYQGDVGYLYGEFNSNNGLFFENLYQVKDGSVFSYVLNDGVYVPISSDYSIDDVIYLINDSYDDDYIYRFVYDGESVFIYNLTSDDVNPTSLEDINNPGVSTFFGEGTEQFPYMIKSVNDLNNLRNNVSQGITYDGEYFQLISNLSLGEFAPIGTVNNPFQGSFDGAGHVITGMTQTVNSGGAYSLGLFGAIGGGSVRQTIKNIEFDSPSFVINLDNFWGINYWRYGTIAGTMYNNATVSNIYVNNFFNSINTSFRFNDRQFFFGGIIGYVTNTATDDSDPGASKRYSIKNCYFSGEYGANFIGTNDYNYQVMNFSNGGIVGRVDYQVVWPESCVVNTNMRSSNGGFISPFLASIKLGNGTSYTDFDNYWKAGRGTITNTCSYIYYELRYDDGWIINYSSDDVIRWSGNSNSFGYIQGVNFGKYIGTNTTEINNYVTLWNNDSDAITYYNNGFHFYQPFENFHIEEIENGIDTSLKAIFSADTAYNYGLNNSNVTYYWYKNGVLEQTSDNNTFNYTRSDNYDIDDIVVYAKLGSIVTYSAVKSFLANPVITFNKNGSTLTATPSGIFFDIIPPSDLSYQWYYSESLGTSRNIISGANGLEINNVNDEYVYYLDINSISSSYSKTFSYNPHNTIYVDITNGSNSNDGLTPSTPVASIRYAYSLLPQSGTVYTNYVVIMGNYSSNEYLLESGQYAKKATITGAYGGYSYGGRLVFYSYLADERFNLLEDDTRFAYMTLDGSSGTAFLMACGHNIIMDEQIRMENYQIVNVGQYGVIYDNNIPDFHIFGGWIDNNNPNLTFTASEITIKSGVYARVVGGSRNIVVNEYTANVLGSDSNKFSPTINININNSTKSEQRYDINTLVGGQADGSIYANVTINLNSGNIGRFVGGNLGYTSSSRDAAIYNLGKPPNSFFGSVTSNLSGGSVTEFFGSSLGRVSTEIAGDQCVESTTYFYGTIVVNVSGTTIYSDIYGAGAGAVTGYNINSSDNLRAFGNHYSTSTSITITGGRIKGSVYGAGYGYSNYIPNCGANKDAGVLYGNSTVTISGGTIEGSVYGAGKGSTAYGLDSVAQVYGSSTVSISGSPTIFGSIYGAGEGVLDTHIAQINGSSDVILTGANLRNNIFGGGNFGSVSETSKINVNNSNVANIYGGGKNALGNMTNVTFTSGSASNIFGGGYSADIASTATVIINGGIVDNVFGGSNNSGEVTQTSLIINGGNVNYAYGGNNQGGNVTIASVNAKNTAVIEYLYGGGKNAGTTMASVIVNGIQVNHIYGCGENSSCEGTYVTIENSSGIDVFGGSNENGSVTSSRLTLTSSNYNSVYGGNNAGGFTSSTIINVNSGTFNDVYGGGDNATSQSSSINIFNGNISNLYGGGNNAILSDTSSINVSNGIIDNLYGGGNNAFIKASNISISGGNITNLYGGGNNSGLETSTVEIHAGTLGSVYGGSNNSGDVSTSNLLIGIGNVSNNITITDVYGGNNISGVTSISNINIESSTISNVYGGGNDADVLSSNVSINNANLNNIYGGGNNANVSGNTYVDLINSNVFGDFFGGGNEGEVRGNAKSYISNSNISGSAYAGGNGVYAHVFGSTYITVDGNSVVGSSTSVEPYEGCIFGGGNSAITGVEENNSNETFVNIVGGHIYGSVYGGANSSVIYGNTNTNIGTGVVDVSTIYTDRNLIESNIQIDGSVFGGGESNSDGDQHFDFNAMSVVGAINVNIDASGYSTRGHSYVISGSIFGSGNYSSSLGTSTINVKKLGSASSPNTALSFQRTDVLNIDNSFIELLGAADRTNDFSDILYTFNWIKKLVIKNNTTLYLHNNANMLEELYSGVDDESGSLVQAQVRINEQTGDVTKNVDNRIYMLTKRNLNVTTRQDATAYGRVRGMTFFGMFKIDTLGNNFFGIYNTSVNSGDIVTDRDIILGSSYVLGAHSTNQNCEVDGFYTNVALDSNEIEVQYIDPTPKNSNFFRWLVGIDSIEYNIELNASKFTSLGTYTLSMLDFSNSDATFNVIKFDSSGLMDGVNIVDSYDVPKIASSSSSAVNTLGLSMKAETVEWTSYGVTKFLSADDGSFTGDTNYRVGNNDGAPLLRFYLYSPKNVETVGNLGTVEILMDALVPINEIEYRLQKVTIIVTLTATDRSGERYYDGSITYGKTYETPTLSAVHITNRSQFSTYYSLYDSASFDSIYGHSNDYYHALVTDFNLPVGTQITMIDYGVDNNNPDYYYFNVTPAVYDNIQSDFSTYNEAVYKLSNFVRMSGVDEGNTYDDAVANQAYYSDEYGVNGGTVEEFVFIFDFSETTFTGEVLNKSMLFELRSGEDVSTISVFGANREQMKYSLYDSSNSVLSSVISGNQYIYYDIRSEVNLQSIVDYDLSYDNYAIVDTNYESSSMGLNVYFYDSDNNRVTSGLGNTAIIYENVSYFADSEGVFRIKLTNKTSNISRKLYILPSTLLETGNYKMVYVLFVSKDGLHNSDFSMSSMSEKNVIVRNSESSIFVSGNDSNKVISGENSVNLSGNSVNRYNIDSSFNLAEPNFRVSLFRRDTTTHNSTTYDEVPLSDLFSNDLNDAGNSKLVYEKILSSSNESNFNVDFTIADSIVSGTYKISFKIYDRDQLVDEFSQYVIVTKNIVEED